MTTTQVEHKRSKAQEELNWLGTPCTTSPETALAAAVLQRAILDVITPGISDKERANALQWLKSAESTTEFMTFNDIVENISDVDIEEFRAQVLKFIDEVTARPEAAHFFRFQRN